METQQFDFVVIGSGPAGHSAAIEAAKAGARTCIVDRRARRGGVCLHAGTIPSKTLREAVMHLCGARFKHFRESEGTREPITLEGLHRRINKVLVQQMDVMDDQLRRNRVEIISGQAEFEDAHHMLISTLEEGVVGRIRGEKILLATGTVPRRPPEIEFDQEVIFDSNFIFSTKSRVTQLPKSPIVAGAGIIGTEYACMFAAMGCQVWLVDQRKELFRFVDEDICEELAASMKRMGVEIILGCQIQKVYRSPEGKAVMELDSGRLEGGALLHAMGRSPCVGPLHVENAGVKVRPGMTLEVDANLRTHQEHIYAAGDVIGFPSLASTSYAQGRMAARHAMGLPVSEVPSLFPFAVYSIPEIAMVGKMEKELRDEGIPYALGIANYRENPKAVMFGSDDGMLKILFCPTTLKIHGVHIIGDLAAEIVHIGLMVIRLEGDLQTLLDTVFNFPTLADLYKAAARNGLKQLKQARAESLSSSG